MITEIHNYFSFSLSLQNCIIFLSIQKKKNFNVFNKSLAKKPTKHELVIPMFFHLSTAGEPKNCNKLKKFLSDESSNSNEWRQNNNSNKILRV
jgi:hypothetical protein